MRSAAVATDGRSIYVVGGSGTSGRVATLQILDVENDSWSFGPTLPEPVDWGTAVWAEGRLHFLGGVTNGAGASTQHLTYDPEASEWAAAIPLPTQIAGTSGLTDGSRIFVFAGNSGGSPAHTAGTYIFDLGAQAWSSGLDMPGARINLAGAYHRGLFYVLGGGTPGLGTSADLLTYDPDANSWAGQPPMPLAREAHGVAASLGRVCAIGGRAARSGNFNVPFDDVTCYDPESRQWSMAPALPNPLQEVAAVAIDGMIFAIGGADDTGSPVATVSALLSR